MELREGSSGYCNSDTNEVLATAAWSSRFERPYPLIFGLQRFLLIDRVRIEVALSTLGQRIHVPRQTDGDWHLSLTVVGCFKVPKVDAFGGFNGRC